MSLLLRNQIVSKNCKLLKYLVKQVLNKVKINKIYKNNLIKLLENGQETRFKQIDT